MRAFMHRVAGGRLLAILAALAVAIGGAFAFRDLPVNAFPDVTPSLVQVFTETEGLAPEEVERYVTYPVETAMSGLPRLDHIRSVSNFGLSVVNVYFEDGTDVYFARQLVAERLAQARGDIPEGFGDPQMGPISTGLGVVMYFRLIDETGARDLTELRELQDWIVKYQLQTVPGVTEVLSLGGFEKQYQVRVDPEALLRFDLRIADVIGALERGNAAEGGQFLEVGAEQYTVRGVGLAGSLDDIRQIVLKSQDGRPVRVADVGEVAIGGGVRQGLATADGQGEVVAGLVLKLQGANTSDVIGRVRDRLEAVNASLPEGVRAAPYYDQAQLVDRASATVVTALWQGALLVALIVFVFLRGWRPGLVVVASIPFSVGFAFIFMRALGMSADLMSLGGVAIAIGMMVDGAIVIAENVDRALRDRPGAPLRELVADSAAEVALPLAAAVAVVIVVFLPLFSLQGVEGKTFRPLAASAALAMTGSLIYALLAAPALSAALMRPRGRATESARGDAFGAWISRGASVFVRHRAAAIGCAAALLALGGLAATRLGSEFTPALEEGDILVRVTMAPSISLTEARETMTRIETRLLDSFPEIETVVSRIGRGEVGAHADPTNNSESFVATRPRAQWRPGMNPDRLRAEISETLAAWPGVVANVGQPIAMSVDELLTGSKAELAVKIFGPETEVLLEASARMEALLSGVEGAADVQADQIVGAPQLVASIDRAAIGRYGMDVQDALEALQAAIGGAEAGVLFEGVRRFPIVVRFREGARDTVESVRRVILTAPDGARVPLEAVARIETSVGPRQITREDGERFIAVQANVRGRDIGSFVEEARGLAEREVALPSGYRIEWGGQFELQQQANARFATVVPVTLGIVFLILLLTFGRLKSAALIVLNIPLALTGGAMALWLAGLPLSVPATVGFIALFGVAIGNGMVLVSFMDAFAREGRAPDLLAAEAAGLRARPVLMTALTTALGLAPLLFATGVGAEVQRPLAVVVTGGLVTSTLMTLLVLPALHRWFAPPPVRHGAAPVAPSTPPP